jgi:hypothetical protein
MRAPATVQAVVLVIVLLSGLATGASCGDGLQPGDEAFVSLPPAERRRELLQRPPGDQVRLFLLVTKAEHPRDLGLADALASGGAAVVPAIVQRLKSDENEQDRLYLLEVLGMMTRFGYYDVSSDPNTVEAARSAVGGISESHLKYRAHAALREILGEEQVMSD